MEIFRAIGRMLLTVSVLLLGMQSGNAATVGVGATQSFCVPDDTQPAYVGSECLPLTGGMLLASGPISGAGVRIAPNLTDRPQGFEGLSLPDIRGKIEAILRETLVKTLWRDVSVFRVDASSIRLGISGGMLLLPQFTVVNLVGSGPGIDASDAVFPGEAASRFLFWYRGSHELVEWTGVWGSILVPVSRVSQVAGGDGGLTNAEGAVLARLKVPATPHQNLTIRAPYGLQNVSRITPVPVPAPATWVGLTTILILLSALLCRRNAVSRSVRQ
ncbi:MAG: hypothetical protein WBH14_10265 [Albidovulum sp.]